MAKETAKTVEAKQPEVAADAPKFTVEKLQSHCLELFGISSCVFAGATHNMTGEFTVEEMKQHIKTWCGQEVK